MQHRVAVPIDAPPARVWSVLVDAESWPAWTRSMVAVARLDQGPLRVGSRAKIRQLRTPVAVWTVTELEPLRSFTWESRSPAMMSTGVHAVERAEAGGLRSAAERPGRR